MVPIIKLATSLKKSSCPESRTHVSEALTLMGQAQYHLSVRRRYNIRPHLKKKYHSLCNISMPITTNLFGDDVAKDIKACESISNVGRETYQTRSGWRGRGRSSRRGGYNSSNYGNQQYSGGYGNRQIVDKEAATPQRPDDPSTQQAATSFGEENHYGRSYSIRTALRNQGLSAETAAVIINSWRPSTHKQYNLAWRKWFLWCNRRNTNPFSTTEIMVLEYLHSLHMEKKSYSVLNTHKAMLLQTLPILGNRWCNDTILIKRFMKGIFMSKPPVPRYKFMWDVSIVLTYLKTLFPLENLSLKLLTLKTVALIALASAPRAQTLVSMNINNFLCQRNCITFTFSSLLKTCREGHQAYTLQLNHFKEEDLCAMHTAIFYMEKTKKLRKASQFFISFVTYNAVSTSTIARWLKLVLECAGINTEYFKAHSFRGAAVSAAFNKGCSLQGILETADWSSDKNFKKFYFRKSFASNISFTKAVFDT